MLRRLFHALELECQGALTRLALERASLTSSSIPIAAAAAELCENFSLLDIDGSDAIDWSEVNASGAISCNEFVALLRGTTESRSSVTHPSDAPPSPLLPPATALHSPKAGVDS